MHQLIKYFGKKEYAEQFLKGELYMNSLAYFWDNGFEDQRDLFEGVSETFDKKSLGLPIPWQQIIDGDVMFRLDAYRYCNLYCFYRVDIDENGIGNPVGYSGMIPYKAIRLPGADMQEFGDTVAIIKNEAEFMKRVIKALEKDWMCVAGDVRYRQIEGSPSGMGGGSYWQSQKLYQAPRLERGKGKTSTKDCFIKTSHYSNQREWRICLFRNMKKEEPYILKVGNLVDIVELVPADKVQERLMQMYMPCIPADVAPQFSGFKGNIRRSEFKEKMYQFDNAMGHLVVTM